MKAVILAGGLGTRLSELTDVMPKPMVTVGGMPIIWHIMKQYLHHGVDEFIICCGYKGYVIKEYFSNYALHNSDVTFDFSKGSTHYYNNRSEPWKVTLVDTGVSTQTGGRLKVVAPYLGTDDTFCFTYGDGLSSHDIKASIEFHRKSGRLATLTAVKPPGRFGALDCKGTSVAGFKEKPAGDNSWINGGFFVLSRKAVDYVEQESTIWEREPMERLATDGQLQAYFHEGFWQPMDTLRDRQKLEELWLSGSAPWKAW